MDTQNQDTNATPVVPVSMPEVPVNPVKPEINIEDLYKIDVRVGTVVAAEKVAKSTKLLKLQVDFGPLGTRQILTGMQEYYAPEDFVGVQMSFVVNLKPRKMMGLESQGMVFALGLGEGTKPTFLTPKNPVPNGEGAH